MGTKIKIFSVCWVMIFTACFAQNENSAGAGRLITIPEGIKRVLRDSRVVKAAALEKDMSFEDSLMARSALFPHLNANLTQTFLKNQPGAKFGAQIVSTAERQSVSYGFDIYQTVFDFGKSLSLYKASQEAVSARQANTESVRRLAVLEFIMSYFDLLESEKMIAVAQKETESLTAYLNDIGHLYEQGAAIKNDLLPAKVKLADAKQKLIAARNLKTSATARLNNILALPLQEKLIVQDIDMQSPQIPEMEASWKTAQEQRPEIAFFQKQITASILSEKAKAVGNFPTLFADTGYSFADNRYQVHEENMFVNLGAKASVFDGGAARAEVFKERYKRMQIKEQRDKLIEDIKLEIENSYLGLKDADEKVAVARDALEESRENVRVNRVKYAEGIATSTDVLEAITLQTNAETNYYNADYELKRNYARLMYAMGIDLSLVYASMGRETDGTKKQ